jgi:anti-sigma factor RsiW
MNCKEIEFALLGSLDGRLSEDERKALESHLAACGDCRARAEELRRLWGALDRLPAVEPSIVFDTRLRARLAAEPRPAGWVGGVLAGLGSAGRWPRLAVTAVVALAVLAVWLAVRPPRAGKQTAGNQAPAVQTQNQSALESEKDFPVVKDLPVLENYDVISNFEALSALPSKQGANQPVE